VLVQARYILVKGGTLQVGSEERPFPGAACITLHGGPDSREIPLYGGKVSRCAALYIPRLGIATILTAQNRFEVRQWLLVVASAGHAAESMQSLTA
jgi:hypothetical protein